MPVNTEFSTSWIGRWRRWLAAPGSLEPQTNKRVDYQRLGLAAALIVTTAVGVRLLHWHDLQVEIENGKMHFGMSELYRDDARKLLDGRYGQFVKGLNPPSDAEVMMHPPGYSLALAGIFKLFGDSTTPWRLIQIFLDALAVLGLFLLARELLPFEATIIAGLLAAVSPQIAFTSLVLTPDSPSILPIVWAMFFIVRAYRQQQLLFIVAAGVLIGISCWLRPNALLLAPFLVLLVVLLNPRLTRWRYAAAFLVATVIVIAPITVRNIIVFHVFTPISLGAGNNLSEGIADYDDQNRFGLLQKDHLVNQWEARLYNRPDYERSLYAPDGIQRDQDRLKRALAIIKKHPLWFAGVMVRRIGFMLTYEKTPLVSAMPPVSHSLAATSRLKPAWSASVVESWSGDASNSPVLIQLSEDQQTLVLNGTAVADTTLLTSKPVPVTPHSDYVLEIPIDLTQGRLALRVTKDDGRTLLASTAVPDAFQGFPRDRQPTNVVQVPFISGGEQQVIVSIRNAGEGPISARAGPMQLFSLGPSAFGWTRLPRLVLRIVQKLFTTWRMLPLIVCGFVLWVFTANWRHAAIAIEVPLYYLLAQSPLHTEHRYVIAIHYFFPMFVAFFLYWLGLQLSRSITHFHRVK